MARAVVIGTVGVVEAFDGLIRDVLKEGRQVVANQGGNSAQLKGARIVIDDTAYGNRRLSHTACDITQSLTIGSTRR